MAKKNGHSNVSHSSETPEWVIIPPEKPSDYLEKHIVVLAKHKDEKYPAHHQIGVLEYYPHRKEERRPAWRVSHIGRSHDYKWDKSTFENLRFGTKEAAATVVYSIWQAIQLNSCPPDIADWIERDARNLAEEERDLRRRFLDVRDKRRVLAYLSKQHNLKIHWSPEEANQNVADLLEFLNEHLDEIYEHFGKDWARSFRSLLTRVVEEVDPSTAVDF